jgi:CheY-like chemotaxis protein
VTSAFARHIENGVADFLETALVVDDEGLPKEPPADAADNEPVPVRSREDLTLVEPVGEELAAAEAQHPLRTKELIDAFADLGIVCGVLAPMEGDAIRERLLKAAARADLVVLDWELHRDGGTTALQLIRELLEQDGAAERRRLRVIAIYTGQTGLRSIVDRVRRTLDLPKDAVAGDGMTLTSENVRIVAFSKPLGDSPPSGDDTREVDEAELPVRLAKEFAKLTSGLVPGVALAALAAVRNETHRLLQALRADMDLGYLGHRVASSFPEDAEAHIVEVVAAEIASVLGDGEVGTHADLEVIRKWLEDAHTESPPLDCGSALDTPRKIETAAVERMLTIGLGRDEVLDGYEGTDLTKKTLQKIRRQAAHLFTNSPAEADASSDVFGLRMATRTLYRRPDRVLQLGTLVLFQEDFMVCVQPRCDSVRLDPAEARAFPFLPLDIADEDDSRHQFIVDHPDGSGLIRLRLHCKPFAIMTFPFNADEGKSVRARDVSGRWNFYATGNRRFQWVADLKPEFAQRVAVDLAAEFARVGLAESELVRLSQRG